MMMLLPTALAFFPYTTLFRSAGGMRRGGCRLACAGIEQRSGGRSGRIELGNRDHLGRAITPAARANSRIIDRKSTRLNSSHVEISYAVFCLKKKNRQKNLTSK